MIEERKARIASRGRLVWYGNQATEEYWAKYWSKLASEYDFYREARRGLLGPFEKVFTKYLPKHGVVIEAGCGLGQILLTLLTRGWRAEGVEYSLPTIQQALHEFPDLPIRQGDVQKLNVSDDYYSGYISLGVIEHREMGPEPFIEEAWRVLKPGGMAFISVPHFNWLRKIKAAIGAYDKKHDGLPFYQYAFAEKEFKVALARKGFRVIKFKHYAGMKTLTDELSLVKYLFLVPYFGPRFRLLLLHSSIFDYLFGHMTMAICKKPA